MKDININIPKDAINILEKLENAGYESYVVGGCVRDSLFNKEPNDWDITTSATPEQMKKALNLKSIDTGIKHGTVTFISNKVPYEVTTFRKDGNYSDGRRPDKVIFSKDIKEDLSRRDFTINAIAYSPKRGLIDPFNGVDDIETKTLKTVRDSNERFNEDGLRVMRAIRFAATHDLNIDKDTSNSIHNCVSCLDNISKERIKTELFKLLSSEDGKQVSNLLRNYKDVIFKAIPKLEIIDNFDQNNKYHDKNLLDHSLEVVERTKNNPQLRMAALIHDIGKPYTSKLGEDGYLHFKGHPKISAELSVEICKDLKMSNKEIENISFMVLEHDNRPSPTNKSIRRFIVKCGDKERAEDLLNLMEADILSHNKLCIEKIYKDFNKALELYKLEIDKQNELSIKDLNINGNDLIKLGYQGKEIGKKLNELFNLVVDGDIPNDKESLIKYSNPNMIFVKEHFRKGKRVKAHFRNRN